MDHSSQQKPQRNSAAISAWRRYPSGLAKQIQGEGIFLATRGEARKKRVEKLLSRVVMRCRGGTQHSPISSDSHEKVVRRWCRKNHPKGGSKKDLCPQDRLARQTGVSGVDPEAVLTGTKQATGRPQLNPSATVASYNWPERGACCNGRSVKNAVAPKSPKRDDRRRCKSTFRPTQIFDGRFAPVLGLPLLASQVQPGLLLGARKRIATKLRHPHFWIRKKVAVAPQRNRPVVCPT